MEEAALFGGSAKCRRIDGVSTWFQEEGPSGPRDCIPDDVARNLDFVLVLGGGWVGGARWWVVGGWVGGWMLGGGR
jgi:hypothetical protein